MGYLEREACWTRRGRAGAIRLPGRGFVAAAFRHRSSRAGDPLLHTHVVVANATQAADGRWTALDGRELYRHAKTAGYLYQAALRAELSQQLGLRWQAVERGAADVEGVPRRVIDHFSQRRAEILELMGARGETSARAAQVATLETRRGKQYGVPVDRLREQWRARAAEHGLDRLALRRLLRPRHERRIERVICSSGWKGRTDSRATLRDSRAATCCRRWPRTHGRARPSWTSSPVRMHSSRAMGSSRSSRWPVSAATAPASCCSSSAPRSSMHNGRARRLPL